MGNRNKKLQALKKTLFLVGIILGGSGITLWLVFTIVAMAALRMGINYDLPTAIGIIGVSCFVFSFFVPLFEKNKSVVDIEDIEED